MMKNKERSLHTIKLRCAAASFVIRIYFTSSCPPMRRQRHSFQSEPASQPGTGRQRSTLHVPLPSHPVLLSRHSFIHSSSWALYRAIITATLLILIPYSIHWWRHTAIWGAIEWTQARLLLLFFIFFFRILSTTVNFFCHSIETAKEICPRLSRSAIQKCRF